MEPLPTITERFRAAFAESAKAGLSQADLARRIGVTRAAVGDWYHGRSVNIRPEHLFAVADALGVEARWLATGKGPRERIDISRDQLKLVTEYHQLNEVERSALRVLVHQLAENQGDYKT